MAAISVKQKIDSSVREHWVQELHRLAVQVSSWVRQEPDWTVEASETNLSEMNLGTYAVPILTIDTPKGRLILEPIARNYPGLGIVELYAWPTLFRVRLLHGEEDTDWRVRVDSGFLLHQDWNRENFLTLADDLLTAA